MRNSTCGVPLRIRLGLRQPSCPALRRGDDDAMSPVVGLGVLRRLLFRFRPGEVRHVAGADLHGPDGRATLGADHSDVRQQARHMLQPFILGSLCRWWPKRTPFWNFSYAKSCLSKAFAITTIVLMPSPIFERTPYSFRIALNNNFYAEFAPFLSAKPEKIATVFCPSPYINLAVPAPSLSQLRNINTEPVTILRGFRANSDHRVSFIGRPIWKIKLVWKTMDIMKVSIISPHSKIDSWRSASVLPNRRKTPVVNLTGLSHFDNGVGNINTIHNDVRSIAYYQGPPHNMSLQKVSYNSNYSDSSRRIRHVTLPGVFLMGVSLLVLYAGSGIYMDGNAIIGGIIFIVGCSLCAIGAFVV